MTFASKKEQVLFTTEHKTLAERDPLLPTSNHAVEQSATHTQISARSSDLYGYMFMALSTLGFSGMSFFAHIAETTYAFPPTSSVIIRAVLHTTLCLIYIARFLGLQEAFSRLTAHQWRLLAIRGMTGALGLILFFIALSLLPVGEAVTIFFCGPIITLLLSNVALGEPLTAFELFASLISFSGVALISQPGADTTVAPKTRIIGALCALASAFLSSAAYVTVRSLGTGIHFIFSVLALGSFSVVVGTVLGGWMTPAQLFRMKEGALISLVAAIFAFAGQCLLSKGLQHCRAGPGVLIRNLDVPMAYTLGLVFLDERPTWFSLVGSMLVLAATIMIGLRKFVRP